MVKEGESYGNRILEGLGRVEMAVGSSNGQPLQGILQSIMDSISKNEAAIRSIQEQQTKMYELLLKSNGSPQAEQYGSSSGGAPVVPIQAGLLQTPSRSQMEEKPFRLMIEGTVGTNFDGEYYVFINEPMSVTVSIRKSDGTPVEEKDSLASATVELFVLHESFEFDQNVPWWDPKNIVPSQIELLKALKKIPKEGKQSMEDLKKEYLDKIKVDCAIFPLKLEEGEKTCTHTKATIGWSSKRHRIKLGARVHWESMPKHTPEPVTAGVSNAFKVQEKMPKGTGSSSLANYTGGPGSSEQCLAPILPFPANTWNASTTIQSHPTTPISHKRLRNSQSDYPVETSEGLSAMDTNQGNNQDNQSLYYVLPSAPDTGGGHYPPQNIMSWDAQNYGDELNLSVGHISDAVKRVHEHLRDKVAETAGNNERYNLLLHLHTNIEKIRQQMEEANAPDIEQMRQTGSWLSHLSELTDDYYLHNEIVQSRGGLDLVWHLGQLLKLLRRLPAPPTENVPPGFGTGGGGGGTGGGGHSGDSGFGTGGGDGGTGGFGTGGGGGGIGGQTDSFQVTGRTSSYADPNFQTGSHGHMNWASMQFEGTPRSTDPNHPTTASLSGQSFRRPWYPRTPNNEEFEYGPHEVAAAVAMPAPVHWLRHHHYKVYDRPLYTTSIRYPLSRQEAMKRIVMMINAEAIRSHQRGYDLLSNHAAMMGVSEQQAMNEMVAEMMRRLSINSDAAAVAEMARKMGRQRQDKQHKEADVVIEPKAIVKEQTKTKEDSSSRVKSPIDECEEFVVLDFKATCLSPEESNRYREEKKTFNPEIVEFSSILVDAWGHLQLEPPFHTYVKPKEHKHLTRLCMEYNGMTQEDVDGAVELSEALQMHESWISNAGGARRRVIVTWGNWDCGKMLKKECERKGLVMPDLFRRWINLNRSFVARYHDRYWGRPVKEALEATRGKVKWEGPPKGGRSHVRNKARLLAFLIEEGIPLIDEERIPHTIYEPPLQDVATTTTPTPTPTQQQAPE